MYRKLKRAIKKNKFLFSFLNNILKYRAVKSEKNYEKIISKIIEGTVIVKAKNIPGEYEIDIRSDILKRIVLTNEYEPDITELILNNLNPNKDAINIGANIGLYANLLATNIKSKQKVLAVEPTPNAYRLLNLNAKRNKNEEKIIFYNGILTNKKGNYSINIIQGKEEYSSVGDLIHSSVKNEEYSTTIVQGAKLDYLVKENDLNPGLIVIDVEGAEMNVLQGAIETLKKYHPIIISELDDELLSNQNTSSIQILEFLKDLDYNVTDIDGCYVKFPFKGNIIGRY